ncbi:hypothetical protein ALC57_02195 [Trachymyrmex cornetzi]|uniref:Uncharacterized protein n=1 Tax=Trachymyrmex cornetzi TaxID=471704 RepID=A0A195EJN8_9HYME|nr:hypothetical protein ALC57_02195 [Trachymyrmex cornetzi]
MFDWLGSVFCVLVAVVLVVVLGLLALLSLELPLALAAAPVASDWPPPPPPPPPPGFPSVPVVAAADCMYLGISMLLRIGWIRSSCSVKLKSGGNSRPLGNRVPCSRNSLKNECAHACNGVMRNDGVYSKSRATRFQALSLCATDTKDHNMLLILSSLTNASLKYHQNIRIFHEKTAIRIPSEINFRAPSKLSIKNPRVIKRLQRHYIFVRSRQRELVSSFRCRKPAKFQRGKIVLPELLPFLPRIPTLPEEYKDMILMKYAVTVMNAENQVTSSVFFFAKLLLSKSKIPTVPPLTSELLQILPIQTAVVGHVKQRLSEGSSKFGVVGNST